MGLGTAAGAYSTGSDAPGGGVAWLRHALPTGRMARNERIENAERAVVANGGARSLMTRSQVELVDTPSISTNSLNGWAVFGAFCV